MVQVATSCDPALPLLRQHDFAALWWGQLISLLGERLTQLALVGLILDHTSAFRDARSPVLLSMLVIVAAAPVLFLAPFTGAWVDRWNLKRVVIVSDSLRCLIVVAIPSVYQMTHSTGPIFFLVFLLFTCNVFFLPAKSSLTPEIVAPPRLLEANAWLAGAGIAATAVGMLGGGWIIDHWGWQMALLINSATYMASVVALLVIRYTRPAHHATSGAPGLRLYLQEVAEGWRVVRSNRTVKLALTGLGAVWLAGGFLQVAGNQHIQRAAQIPGMERVGVLMCALGLGAGISTWWINTRGRSFSRPRLLGGGLILGAAGVALFALTTLFALFAVAAFLIGVAVAPAFTLTETLLQEGTEVRQRGRVFTARDFLMRLLAVIGAATAGWTTPSIGIRPTLLMAAGLVAGAGVLVLSWGRTDRLRALSASARPEIDPEPLA